MIAIVWAAIKREKPGPFRDTTISSFGTVLPTTTVGHLTPKWRVRIQKPG